MDHFLNIFKTFNCTFLRSFSVKLGFLYFLIFNEMKYFFYTFLLSFLFSF